MKFTQLSILDTAKSIFGRSRRTDPITSKQAGEKNSVGLGKQALKILEVIKVCNGGTRGELGQLLSEMEGINFHEAIAQVSRRAPDLLKLGLVRKGEPRKCFFLGSNQITWFAVEKDQK